MTKKELLFKDLDLAVKNLREAVNQSSNDLMIDGTIKRFELCYELSWKVIKIYLSELGIICKSPRDCFKAAKENDLINEETTWLGMIDDRNLLVHTYTREFSRDVFERIKELYIYEFENLLSALDSV